MSKKGFTLIELLAVIIILSVIVLITAVATNNIINDSKKSLSDIQINRIKESAKAYYIEEGNNQDNVCINVSELIKKGYINNEEILNPKSNEEMLGSVKISYIDDKYTYEYKDHECIKCTVNKQNEDKYTVGDIVTCELEESTDIFYIIKDAELTAESIDTLTGKNIHITKFRQSDNAGETYFSTEPSESANLIFSTTKYVYGNFEGNLIYPIVEGYVNYLNENLINTNGKLMSLEEAENLGCNLDTGICPNLSWLFATSYFWLGANVSVSDGVIVMSHKESFGSCGFAFTEKYYVRPIITIPTINLK